VNATDFIDAGALSQARQHIAHFITETAERRAEQLGFGWRTSASAPIGYPDRRREFVAARHSGLPLRVNPGDDGCQLVPPLAVEAFSFWHATEHALRELTCSPAEEMELAVSHLDTLRTAGFGPGSLEHRLFHADTVGQAYFNALTGRSVSDPERFGIDAVTRGVDEAARIEIRAAQSSRHASEGSR
jgi:hypothetical protein